VEPHYYIEYLGNSVELPLGETVVGRDIGCKLRFNDPAVSRRHLRFIRRAGEIFVEDLNSSNGTKLNGRPVSSPTRLDDGDAIVVGGRTLFVRSSDGEDACSQTLNLAELPSDARALRLRTSVTQPVPTQQRCPNCGSVVIELADECATCRYAWPGARPATRMVAKRRDTRLPVALELLYVSSELEIEASSRDLSTSGVFVVSQVLEPIGTPCTLTFLVDGGSPLQIAGVVRRVVEHEDADHSGLGVEFSRVGPDEKRWLDALITRLAK
jgi:hypothetical protein